MEILFPSGRETATWVTLVSLDYLNPHPMKLCKTFLCASVFAVMSALSVAYAGGLAGHWTAEFDSPIGPQKYTYDFKTEGDKTTGKATHDHSMGKGEAVLSEIKLSGEDVAFVEKVEIQGTPLTITYTGKLSGDEMKLTRQVGDFGSEEIVAKRATAAATSAPAETK